VRRPLSLLAAAVVTTLATLVSVPAAFAAGTGGVELTPLPTVDSQGHPVTAFHVAPGASARFALRNLTTHPATVLVYAAAATRSPSGAYAVGGPGSARWIAFPDRTVTLAPHAVQLVGFRLNRAIPKGSKYGAIVLEQRDGMVVQRAATLVYLTAPGTPLKTAERALLPILVAGLLIGAAVAAHRRVRAHR
jgi:hypothetical protein